MCAWLLCSGVGSVVEVIGYVRSDKLVDYVSGSGSAPRMQSSALWYCACVGPGEGRRLPTPSRCPSPLPHTHRSRLQTDHAVLSDAFDMDSYNELVDLANSAAHADLFATK